VLGRNERVLVYQAAAGDTWGSVAAQFLGGADQDWQLVQANPEVSTLSPGQPIVVPLVSRHRGGVSADGAAVAQSVPILCYHRLGPGNSRMTVSPARFEAQLAWLADNGWRVVRLSELAEFLAGKRALPPRSVVITFDDGWESVHRFALPLLRQYKAPATLFVYTDLIGGREALSWTQIDEMQRSGWVDVQAHSKTHRNLTERLDGESDAAYRARIDMELRQPRAAIERAVAGRAGKVRHFAFPYGDTNDAVVDALQRQGYEIGVTVQPGGNPFYAWPLALRRVMIFGDHDLDEFRARLQGANGAPGARPLPKP
jgi:peptidoglycan/xylan/chitin deacetylase (PgdA/CDA1 family)